MTQFKYGQMIWVDNKEDLERINKHEKNLNMQITITMRCPVSILEKTDNKVEKLDAYAVMVEIWKGTSALWRV